jgi:hypothetical protein
MKTFSIIKNFIKKFSLFNKQSQFKKNYLQWLFLLIFAAFSVWLMFFTFGYRDGQFLLRSRLWSDFAAHLPLIRSFSLGNNFPPEYPQFAGEPIRYHFLFYFFVGVFERLGLNIAWSLNLLSAVGFFGLLLMIYLFAKLFAQSDSKKSSLVTFAGLLAVILFLFNGSLTFVDYFKEAGLSWNSLVSIFQLEQFVNFGPWNGDDISAFWHWNVYTNQRHLAFSIALVLLLIWPLVKAVFDPVSIRDFSIKNFNKFIWFFIILALIALPFLNLAAYAMAVIFIFAWLILNPKLIKQFGSIYVTALVFSLPSFAYFYLQGTESIQVNFGFLAQEKTLMEILFYWWRNLGLYLVLWPILFLVSNLKQKKWLLIFSFYFVLANLFQLSADIINNHKLINFFQIGLVILLAAKLVNFWARHWSLKIVVIVLFIPLTLSGVLDAAAIINDRQATIQDSIHQPIGEWIIKNTSPNSTFIITNYLYNPASLVGRKTYLDYGYFAWSMGYDDSERRANLPIIFSFEAAAQQWCELLSQEKIDYILVSPGKGDLDIDVHDSWLVRENEPSYRSPNDYLLYKITNICPEELGQL